MCFYLSEHTLCLSRSFHIIYVFDRIVSTWTIFIALWQQFEYLMYTFVHWIFPIAAPRNEHWNAHKPSFINPSVLLHEIKPTTIHLDRNMLIQFYFSKE